MGRNSLPVVSLHWTPVPQGLGRCLGCRRIPSAGEWQAVPTCAGGRHGSLANSCLCCKSLGDHGAGGAVEPCPAGPPSFCLRGSHFYVPAARFGGAALPPEPSLLQTTLPPHLLVCSQPVTPTWPPSLGHLESLERSTPPCTDPPCSGLPPARRSRFFPTPSLTPESRSFLALKSADIGCNI